MPSLVRFLTIVGTIFGVTAGSLYLASVMLEPHPREITKVVPGLKANKL